MCDVLKTKGKLKIMRHAVVDEFVKHTMTQNHDYCAIVFKKHHFSLIFIMFHKSSYFHILSFPNSFNMCSYEDNILMIIKNS